jgi:hypothetical protein
MNLAKSTPTGKARGSPAPYFWIVALPMLVFIEQKVTSGPSAFGRLILG